MTKLTCPSCAYSTFDIITGSYILCIRCGKIYNLKPSVPTPADEPTTPEHDSTLAVISSSPSSTTPSIVYVCEHGQNMVTLCRQCLCPLRC